VKKYPAYTHDDVFYLEYDFAMVLLMMIRDDADYSVRYQRKFKEVNKNKGHG
jgi:hypothetical protein